MSPPASAAAEILTGRLGAQREAGIDFLGGLAPHGRQACIPGRGVG